MKSTPECTILIDKIKKYLSPSQAVPFVASGGAIVHHQLSPPPPVADHFKHYLSLL